MATKTLKGSQRDSQNVISICAFINDHNNIILHGIIDQLGSLEDGTLLPLEDYSPSSGGGKFYQIRLDTKYYVADVPIMSFPSFEALANELRQKKGKNGIEVRGLMVCANRTELKPDFLARIAQCSRDLESVEVKTLILMDFNTSSESRAENGSRDPNVVNDVQLNKFCIQKDIELIPLIANSTKHNSSASDKSEEGTTGIARVVEVLETVKWPGLRMKPNPVGCSAHRQRLRNYILEQEDELELAEDRKQKHLENICEDIPIKCNDAKKERAEAEDSAGEPMDYPDDGDEEAILEWFNQPLHQSDIQINDFPSTFAQPWKQPSTAQLDSKLQKTTEETLRRRKQTSKGEERLQCTSNFQKRDNDEKERDLCRELVEHFDDSDDPLQLSTVLGNFNQNNRQMVPREHRMADGNANG